MLKNRHISYLTWLVGSMMMLMLTACSSSDEDYVPEGDAGQQKKPATLAVYVYAPEPATAQKNAARRRADVGDVDVSTPTEAEIKSLQLWIYESIEPGKSEHPGQYVGYLETNEVASLNTGEGALYQIPVSDDFASRKPSVDVFVQANVKNANCGVGTLNESTTRAELMTGAKIEGHFGLGNKQTSVPTQGLPMAGKLTVQPVVGDAPALRVGDMSQVSIVRLTRAVSKLRFVFAKTTGQPQVSITSIKMNAGMIPEVEYLFDKTQPLTYNANPGELLSSTISDIAQTTDPTDYIYFNQEAQAYENLINTAGLTVRGPIYLRESDKRLAGTISYSIAGVEQEPVEFQMQQAGDFLRNHTWIVYAYYAGSGKLQVQTIYVKDWVNRTISHELYNW